MRSLSLFLGNIPRTAKRTAYEAEHVRARRINCSWHQSNYAHLCRLRLHHIFVHNLLEVASVSELAVCGQYGTLCACSMCRPVQTHPECLRYNFCSPFFPVTYHMAKQSCSPQQQRTTGRYQHACDVRQFATHLYILAVGYHDGVASHNRRVKYRFMFSCASIAVGSAQLSTAPFQ